VGNFRAKGSDKAEGGPPKPPKHQKKKKETTINAREGNDWGHIAGFLQKEKKKKSTDGEDRRRIKKKSAGSIDPVKRNTGFF